MSEMRQNTVHVTKIEAGRRLLNAAILMYFRDDDELAVHAVGHGALRVLRDLLASRGTDVHEDLLVRGMYEMLRAYRRGTLDKSLSNDAWFQALVARIPADIWILYDTIDYEQVRGSLLGFNPKEFWGAFNKSYNFLKHAERDQEGALDLETVDNLTVLVYASSAYTQLGFAPTVEMLTLVAYYLSLQPFDTSPPEILRPKVEVLRKYEGTRRKLACRYVIGDRIRSVVGDEDDA